MPNSTSSIILPSQIKQPPLSRLGVTVVRGWRKDLGNGWEIADDVLATALLSTSYYWGPTKDDWKGDEWRFNFVQRIKKGTAFELRPFKLTSVRQKFDLKTRRLSVLFIISGKSNAIEARRQLFNQNRAYIMPEEFQRVHGQCRTIVWESVQEALKKIKEFYNQGETAI